MFLLVVFGEMSDGLLSLELSKYSLAGVFQLGGCTALLLKQVFIFALLS